jgi:hypothetical protein
MNEWMNIADETLERQLANQQLCRLLIPGDGWREGWMGGWRDEWME